MSKGWLNSILLILLVGCTTHQPKPLCPTITLAQFEKRSLDDANLRSFLEQNSARQIPVWPLPAWDASQLTLAAFYFHPEIEVARAQWRSARAAVETAGGRPNPTVSVIPGYNFNAASGVSPWMPGFNFDLPIETAGKRGYRVARANHLAEATRLNVLSTAWQVHSRLRSALKDLSAAERRGAVLKQQRTVQQEMVKRFEQRLQAGTISSFEMSSIRIALNKLDLDISAVQRMQYEARIRVAEAIGLPSEALTKIRFDLTALENKTSPGDISEASKKALQNRPDLLALLSEYASSETALRGEIAKQYPDIHFGPAYQWDQGENKWSLGVMVELPLFNRNKGPIAEAKAKRDEIAARFAALQAQIRSKIDLVTIHLRTAQQQLALTDDLLASQERQKKSIEEQVTAGTMDKLELLRASLERSTLELSRVDAQAQVQLAISEVEDALQHSFSEEVNIASALHDAISPDFQNGKPMNKTPRHRPQGKEKK